VTLRVKATAVAFRLRHPRTTVRWRLTLLYSALFLACGAALLGVTYTLVAHASIAHGPSRLIASPQRAFGLITPANQRAGAVQLPPGFTGVVRSAAGRAAVTFAGSQQRIADLHQLEVQSAIALAIMAVISAALGWVIAGRVLRPLRTITASTQQISEANLHQRLAIQGPPDELTHLADTIDGLLERLEGAFDAQRRFVANASHELRTPLTAVRALLEMTLSDPHPSVETVSSRREKMPVRGWTWHGSGDLGGPEGGVRREAASRVELIARSAS
jgi:signal transduction histidine kinase